VTLCRRQIAVSQFLQKLGTRLRGLRTAELVQRKLRK